MIYVVLIPIQNRHESKVLKEMELEEEVLRQRHFEVEIGEVMNCPSLLLDCLDCCLDCCCCCLDGCLVLLRRPIVVQVMQEGYWHRQVLPMIRQRQQFLVLMVGNVKK